ncbi:MAG: hypothetical protein KF894_28505 [Labilithrix sp.]|nr:hypothetical protein [Labilithrix sp.]
MTPGEELAEYLGARPSELDGRKVVPMLCERAEADARVLERAGWLYELKLDGVRIIADKRGDEVALTYRKLRDATESYPEIADTVRALADERLVLDGEIVAFDEEGRPDFQLLARRIQAGMSGRAARSVRAAAAVPVVFVVFDVLAIGQYDVRAFPLEARKEILARVLPPEGAAGGLLRRHPTFDDGVALFRLCQERRLEGVVAKRLGTPYRSGERTFDWLKIKAELDAELVVIGWTEGEGDRSRLGALDLGAYEGDRLVFRGRVGSGLDASTIELLLERLASIEVAEPVAEGRYPPKARRHHCRPELVVSVRYGGYSRDPSGARYLRFPVFRGVRPDVSPRDCTAAPDDAVAPPRPKRAAAKKGGAKAPRTKRAASPGAKAALGTKSVGAKAVAAKGAGVGRRLVTAPSRAALSDGTTKDVLCTYFEAVAPALLRHAAGRVSALLGPGGAAIWPPPNWTPELVRTVAAHAGQREVGGYVIDSLEALFFAVEVGARSIEHAGLVLDRPGVADFVAVRARAAASAPPGALAVAARAVRALATEIGLPAAVLSAGPCSVAVLVGVGAAPALAAAPLASILAGLAGGDVPAGVKLDPAEAVVTPFAPCLTGPGESVVVAVPLAWSELDDVDLPSLGLACAAARAGAAARSDALDPIADPASDVAAATKALERIVGERAPPRG